MCKELRSFGLPVICVDARHMAAALSARIKKRCEGYSADDEKR
ncbi:MULTISPECIES: hypothetical protein [Wolbachia]|nr:MULTISPECIES: hypothetical protein [Wolbachia]WOE64001.1 hypothetical protein R0F63_00250 [Wolbachia endosymbiont of Zaprionus tsacasi]